MNLLTLVGSHPGFTSKVATSTHTPLEPGCDDYSFLDQAIDDSEHGLDSILMDSINTPELCVSFDEADVVPSSVSLGFLSSDSTISDTSRLQLAPSIESHKLWCQGRA